MRNLHRFIGVSDHVVDIGANVGQYAARMSKLVGDKGKVFAFEALPSTYEVGRRAVEETNVQWRNIALSDKGGNVTLAVVIDSNGLINTGLTSIVAMDGAADKRVMMRAERLDDLFADRKQRISFIKCDVEGHEANVVQGGVDLVSTDRPVMLVETSEKTFYALLELLLPFGYAAFLCGKDGHLRPIKVPLKQANFNCFFIPSKWHEGE